MNPKLEDYTFQLSLMGPEQVLELINLLARAAMSASYDDDLAVVVAALENAIVSDNASAMIADAWERARAIEGDSTWR